jgi:hypothetical protein
VDECDEALPRGGVAAAVTAQAVERDMQDLHVVASQLVPVGVVGREVAGAADEGQADDVEHGHDGDEAKRTAEERGRHGSRRMRAPGTGFHGVCG